MASGRGGNGCSARQTEPPAIAVARAASRSTSAARTRCSSRSSSRTSPTASAATRPAAPTCSRKLDGLWKSRPRAARDRVDGEAAQRARGAGRRRRAAARDPRRALRAARRARHRDARTSSCSSPRTRTRCARTTCSPSTRAAAGITSARCATTRRCSAATSTIRTCACASSGCASSPAAPRRSPARRSRRAMSSASRPARAIGLMRELGRGATGVVYLARDAELDRDVAVKLLHPHLAGTERADALARFFHEARVMASLRHPNVVAVLDHGRGLAPDRDGARRRRHAARRVARARSAHVAPRDRAPRPGPVARSPPRTAAASSTAISSPAT